MKHALYFLPVVLFLLLAIGLAAKLYQGQLSVQSPLIGKKIPNWSAPSAMPGQPIISSKDFNGQTVLINIFASWCSTCRVEHPALMELSKKKLVPIIGIDWKDTPKAVTGWLGSLGNPYTAIAADKDGRIAVELGITGAPESYLIDKNGHIIYHIAGPLTEEVITRDLLPLFREK